MPDYKSMYQDLFKKVTEAIEILQQAQIDAEEKYILSSEADENKIVELKVVKNEKEL